MAKIQLPSIAELQAQSTANVSTPTAPTRLPSITELQPLAPKARPAAAPSLPSIGELLAAKPKAPEKSDYIEALSYGMKSALVPFAVSKAEYDKDRDWAEMLVAAATDMTASIAPIAVGTAAAVGAGVAAPVVAAGAAVAAVSYAVYAGIGNEYLRSRSAGQDISVARAGAQVALELNPLVGKAGRAFRHLGKLATPVRVAAQAAGSAGVEYSYSESGLAATIAGGIGGLSMGLGPLLGAIAARPVAKATTVPKQATAALMGTLTAKDTAADLLPIVERRMAAAAKANAFDLDADDTGFQKWVVGRPGMPEGKFTDAYGWYAKNHTEKSMAKHYRMYKEQQVALEAVDEVSKVWLKQGGMPDGDQAFGAFRKFVSDGKFTARNIDKRLPGLDFEGALDLMSDAADEFAVGRAGFLGKGKALRNTYKDIDGKTLMNAMRQDPKNIKDAHLKAAVGEWRKWFDDAHQHLKDMGYSIGYLDNYTPSYRKRGAELARSLEAQVKLFKAGKLNADETDAVSQIATDLLGRAPMNARDYDDAIKAALDPNSVKRARGFEMTALFEKTGTAPEWSKIDDIHEASIRYINGNFKAAYLDEAFTRLYNVRNIMSATLGADSKAVEYVGTYMKHMSGNTSGAEAMMRVGAEKLRYNAAKFIDGEDLGKFATALSKVPGAKLSARVVKELPDIMGVMQAQLYPSFLGARPDAVLRNLAQPWLLTATEFDGTYGYGLVSRAYAATAKDKLAGKSMTTFLQEQKQLPSDFINEARGIEAEFRRAAGALRLAEGAVDQFNSVIMAAYKYSDIVNRYVTWHAGQKWAADILSNNPKALAALDRSSGGLKSRIRIGLANGSLTESDIAPALSKYLISKTQFRYGKTQMNELGRHAGLFISTFSKWPVMITSDVAELAADKRWSSIATRYLAPAAALGVAGIVFESADPDPAVRFVIGNAITKGAPISSLDLSFLEGSPAMQAAKGTVNVVRKSAMLQYSGEEAAEDATAVLRAVTPVAGPAYNVFQRWQKAKNK